MLGLTKKTERANVAHVVSDCEACCVSRAKCSCTSERRATRSSGLNSPAECRVSACYQPPPPPPPDDPPPPPPPPPPLDPPPELLELGGETPAARPPAAAAQDAPPPPPPERPPPNPVH